MITVNINNVPHIVKFQHLYTPVFTSMHPDAEPQDIPVETHVKIYPKDEPEMFVEGISRLHWNDNPNKAIGRKLALTRAVNAAFPDDKNARKAVWDAVKASGMNIDVTIPK
jgi:hypothetical protein